MSLEGSTGFTHGLEGRQVRLRWAVLGGVLAGLVLLVAGIWLYYSRVELKTVVIPPESMVAVGGSARWAGGAVAIENTDEKGRATFMAALAPFPAALYDAVSWQIPGFTTASGGALLWVSDRAQAGQVFTRRLTLPDVRDGRISMRDHPDWRGSISQVGVMIQGPFQQPVRIESLRLEPRVAHWSLEESWSSALRGWSKADPWNGGSVHFLGVTDAGERFTPTVWVAIWTASAIAVFLLVSIGLGARVIAITAITLLLAGWFALDFRWQFQLLDNVVTGLDQPESLSNVVADRKLPQLAKDIPASARIFVLSDDTGSYAPLRARYLLAPHRVHVGYRTLSQLTMLKPGDHVLIISTPERLQFDQTDRALISGERRIGAELVASDVAFGSLFRITRGT
jgi:hypothetical protein